MEELNRRQKQKKAYRVFCGDYAPYISAILTTRHSTETADEVDSYNNPQRNVLKRAAGLLSDLYAQSPRRSSEDKAINEFLQSGIVGLDTTLEEITKLVYGVGDWFVAPFADMETGKIYLDTVEPWLMDVELVRGKVESITVPMAGYTVKWFSNGRYNTYDAKGNLLTSKDSGFGCLPIIWFRQNPASKKTPWSIQNVMDLVNGTIDLGVDEAYYKRISYLRSFKVLYNAGSEQDAGDMLNIPINAKAILPFEVKASEMADPNAPYLTSIQRQEQDLASTRGISNLMYSGNLSTADQMTTVSEESRQNWKSSIKIFSTPERHLLYVSMALSNKYLGTNYNLDAEIAIDYIEPISNLDAHKKSLENLELDIKLGTDSPITYLLRNNPDIQDREAAIALVNQNIEDKSFIHTLMMEHNQSEALPGVGDNPGRTPQENGALGGAVGGKTPEEQAEILKKASGSEGVPLPSSGYRETVE